jgi:hypothetical protein
MAHIIMAYKDPSQIERLVKMSHPGFDFYIHVDTKFDQSPFEYLQNIERVYLIKNRGKIDGQDSALRRPCLIVLRKFLYGQKL